MPEKPSVNRSTVNTPNSEAEGSDPKPEAHTVATDDSIKANGTESNSTESESIDDTEAAENKNIERIAEALPPERREELYAVIRQQRTSHSGWLPTPEYLREYEAILPGLAERIVALPEREQNFRHTSMNNVIKKDYGLRSAGQWMGMTSLVLILGFCIFLAILGYPIPAAWVAGTVIVGTVGVFVTGQLVNGNSSTSKDLVE